jgi:hypothetical protein
LVEGVEAKSEERKAVELRRGDEAARREGERREWELVIQCKVRLRIYTTFGAVKSKRKKEKSAPRTRMKRTKESKRTQTNDLSPSPCPQFRCNNTSNPVPDHLLLVVDENSGVVVKADVPPVWSPSRVLGAHYYCSSDVTTADFGGGGGSGGGLGREGVRAGTLDDNDDLVTCKAGECEVS